MRLIRTPPSDPAFNLALDEALLRSGTPTLRFYSWEPPGFSLGFFQKRDSLQVPPGFTVVRRPTGGGAIAHSGELTIAWIGQRRRVETVYDDINAIVANALGRQWGVNVGRGKGQPEAAPEGLCFDAHTCYDLMADGRKIFGSAQRRGGDRFLLHGSLVLEPNRISPGAIGLSELLPTPVTRQEAEEAILTAARNRWQVEFTEQTPTKHELAEAENLVRDRYANETWTNRR